MAGKRFFGFEELGAWIKEQLLQVRTEISQRALSSSVFTKTESQANFLGKTATAADSAKLGNKDPSHYAAQSEVSQLSSGLADLVITFNDSEATPVNEYVTLTVDQVKQYDLRTLLGTDYAKFDLKTAVITVRAKDTNPASPLFNVHANAEALISYGLRDERYVMVVNQSTGPLDVYIKVDVKGR